MCPYNMIYSFRTLKLRVFVLSNKLLDILHGVNKKSNLEAFCQFSAALKIEFVILLSPIDDSLPCYSIVCTFTSSILTMHYATPCLSALRWSTGLELGAAEDSRKTGPLGGRNGGTLMKTVWHMLTGVLPLVIPISGKETGHSYRNWRENFTTPLRGLKSRPGQVLKTYKYLIFM